MRIATIVIAVIGGLILLSMLTLGWRYISAPIRGIVGQQEIMESPGSRIYNYNRFFRLCSNVQTYEDQLDAQMLELEGNDNDDHVAMIRRNISGLTARRADAINTYNAETRMVATGGRFKDDGLPESIERSVYDGTNKTQCS